MSMFGEMGDAPRVFPVSPDQLLGALLGARPTTQVIMASAPGASEGDLTVMHPIFGNLDPFFAPDAVRKGAAILGEVAYEQVEAIDALHVAQAEFDAAEAKNVPKRTFARLRRKEPVAPDKSEIHRLEARLDQFGGIFEHLSAALFLLDSGLIDDTAFDQVVERLGVAELLGHEIESVCEQPEPEEPASADTKSTKDKAPAKS